ncbi:MAG: hypothetical protein RSD35_00775 [Oscillospiraceae bacterium]
MVGATVACAVAVSEANK